MFTFFLKSLIWFDSFFNICKNIFFYLRSLLYKKSRDLRHFRHDWKVTKRITKKIFIFYFLAIFVGAHLNKFVNFSGKNYFSDIYYFVIQIRYFINSKLFEHNWFYFWMPLRKCCFCCAEYLQDFFDKTQYLSVIFKYFLNFKFFSLKKKNFFLSERETEK